MPKKSKALLDAYGTMVNRLSFRLFALLALALFLLTWVALPGRLGALLAGAALAAGMWSKYAMLFPLPGLALAAWLVASNDASAIAAARLRAARQRGGKAQLGTALAQILPDRLLALGFGQAAGEGGSWSGTAL